MPCLTLEIGALDTAHYGVLFYFFSFACYLSSSLLKVDPFDQPGVEAYKIQMFRMLWKNWRNRWKNKRSQFSEDDEQTS